MNDFGLKWTGNDGDRVRQTDTERQTIMEKER